MGRLGFPVPPGFTISTKVCELFYNNKKKLNVKLVNKISSLLIGSIDRPIGVFITLFFTILVLIIIV